MRGRPFPPRNQFGKGRPRGSRNKATVLEQQLQQCGEPLVNKLVMMALQGNQTALRLCFDRLVPRRERTLKLKLPLIQTVEQIAAAMQVMTNRMRRGELTARDLLSTSEVLERQGRLLETARQAETGQDVLIREYVGVDVDKV